MKITNDHGISLPIAVWLLFDEYDYIREENYISATALLKGTKKTIMASRVPKEERSTDVSELLSSRMGNAIHDSIEKAWKENYRQAMKLLDYPEDVINRMAINPTADERAANPSMIPVYIEQRTIRELRVGDKVWKVGGKLDMAIDGRLFDIKTTSVWSYMKGSKDEDYSRQGSIYKWLNPDKIESDHIFINFLFTDWQRVEANRNPDYPQLKTLEHPVQMMDAEDTQQFMIDKIQELSRLWDKPEELIPECSDEDLWRTAPSYRYFSDPAKAKDPTARSTKNFDSLAEANAFAAEKGKGVVVTKPGEVKACAYCPGFAACKQKDRYVAEGS